MLEREENGHDLPDGDGFNLKNIEKYKIVRIVYDKKVDNETKKQIFRTSMKN